MNQKRTARRRKRSLSPAFLRLLLFIAVTLLIWMWTFLRLTGTVRSTEFPAAQKELPADSTECREAGIAKDYLPGASLHVSAEENSAAPAAAESELLALPVTVREPAEDSAAMQTQPAEQPETELVNVEGKYYRGKMLIVKDPSRVFVGVSGPLGAGYAGKLVPDIIHSYGAMAGVNASGFDDPNGVGNGGTPLGMVMSEGQMKYGSLAGTYEVIGFDNNNKLHCGWMTGQQAVNLGIRDAVCFGPVLVSNGNKQYNLNANGHGAYNPRTAIGQREDGTVLILMLEGRQISSLGASMDTTADIMLEYGAVNAANLDGGASTVMYYEDELLTNCSSLYGSRAVPTAILVRPES